MKEGEGKRRRMQEGRREEEDARRKKEEEDARRNSNLKKRMEQLKGQTSASEIFCPETLRHMAETRLEHMQLNIIADTSFIVLNAAELSIDTTSISFTHPATANSSNSNQVTVI
ncbi:hypothetical protein CFP56_044080 [Quercus suber]|uniref:Uncharacterized protein n=1 Tax=Quercus suber TaxID=58331 RepID=A0AAW0IQ27_QUESU